MSVELVTSSTPELVEAMERLIPQLSRTAPALTAQQCADLVAQPGVFLFVFRPDADAPTGAASQAGPSAQGAGTAAGAAAPILGMLTLATFTIPTGLRAWVEDVVVDGQARAPGRPWWRPPSPTPRVLAPVPWTSPAVPAVRPPTVSTAGRASNCARRTSTATSSPNTSCGARTWGTYLSYRERTLAAGDVP